MKEAEYYEKEDDRKVICALCAHRCRIKPGKRGLCGVRENQEGVLYSLVYGRLVASGSDPIEKKPLFHFLPGSRSYSISTVGCNFQCRHCQNYHISQFPQMHGGAINGDYCSAELVVLAAKQNNCASISYTYVEPTIFFEFARDCSVMAKREQLKNVFVSNGYMTPAVTRDLALFLDAINIDVKSFSDSFYKKICKARLQPVLDTVRLMYELGVWVEVTTLLIPGLNDSRQELQSLAGFIRSVDPGIPWHVTAFHPTFKLQDCEATSVATLNKARQIGIDAGLYYVYVGNIPGQGGENTRCPGCRQKLIIRNGYNIFANNLQEGKCSQCGASIAGVWAGKA